MKNLMTFDKLGYPGDNNFYTQCDVCSKKIRAKDAIYKQDPRNTLKGLVLCKNDNDQTNPQVFLKGKAEQSMRTPHLVRIPSDDAPTAVFISSSSEIETGNVSDPTGRAPGGARLLTIVGASSSQVEFIWFGPDETGSSGINGWVIERETPVGGGFSTLETTTDPVMYYKDTSVSASTTYNYRVKAVGGYANGSESNEASITTNA